MSQENVDAARQGYELWNGDDRERWLQVFHPEVVFATSGIFPGFDPVYHGREGMARFADAMLEAWESLRLEPTEIEDRGEHIVVALRFWGKGRASGVETTIDFHHVLRFREGLVDRLISHRERDKALEEAGLSA